MVKVAGIRFRKAGKIYYFDPGSVETQPGEHVIVETVRGVEYGTVVLANKEVDDKEVIQPLKKVLRLATEDDKETEIKNKEKEREAFGICKSKIFKHGLEMKLIDCEYTFDNNKLLFYFTADGRVDFRELVKDLASVFKTRIELRQIGVRDETKMIGSIGICGRTLCCHAHLSDFHPVSIKMAKDQNLSLNPTKISGVCGRLMCCLKYEEDTYKELNRNLPRVGNKVKVRYSGEIAEVINTNIIRQLVKVVIRKEDGAPEILEMKLEDLELQRDGKFQKRSPRQEQKIDQQEAKALKALEEAERKERQEKDGDNRQKTQRQQRSKSKNSKRPNTDRSDKSPKADKKTNKQGNAPKSKSSEGNTTDNKRQQDQKNKSNSTKRIKNSRPRNKSNKPKTDGGQIKKG